MSGAFELDGERVTLDARIAGGRLVIGDRSLEVAVRGNEVLLRDGAGRSVRAFVVVSRDEVLVSIGGRVARLARSSGRPRPPRSQDDAALEAPMPGTCREVLVGPGTKVEKGARLVIVEAMKMEHEIRAPRAGTVKSVRVKKGDPVSPGEALVELEA